MKNQNQVKIIAMFDGIARNYDLMNALMTFGRHGAWRRRAADACGVAPGARVLDLCCGTGDLLLAMAGRAGRGGLAVGLDYSWDMMAAGRGKLRRSNTHARLALARGDAQELPFADGAFDAVSIGFGIRNVVDPGACLREMFRVLRPGGRALILEAGRPRSPLMKQVYLFYSTAVVPRLARALSTDSSAYGSYLPDTIMKFPARGAFTDLMRGAGFVDTAWTPLNFGTIYIYTGARPDKPLVADS